MNLFIETLKDYLTEQLKQSFSAVNAPKEARFVVQSLDPQGTLVLFQALDADCQRWNKQLTLAAYFRVATRLWKDWQENAAGDDEAAAVTKLVNKDWIDQEDRLTWYRNKTAYEEGKDALIVVLVGMNHATDQGGLADFHQVDERRLAARLKNGFLPWLERLAASLSLDANASELKNINELLKKLFEMRPLRLIRLAAFLQPMTDQGECFSHVELQERLLKRLPFWDIPPLLFETDGNPPSPRDLLKALEMADTFISHKNYKSNAAQKKDWEKIEKALDEPDFILPTCVDGIEEYADIDAYRQCLDDFIHRADNGARERLLRTDFMPLYRILTKKPKKKTRSSSPSPSVKAFNALSHQAMLEAIWDALLHFQKEDCEEQPLWERLGGIQVNFECFHHDLTGDEAEGIGPKEQAGDLLRGCLGGLAEHISAMKLRLPTDQEEAERLYGMLGPYYRYWP